MAPALKWLFNRTLNNVWFGISMMLLIAIYVAVGSGKPEVREYFEMDELGFFNAWPLKLLMALLVASLVTVTFVRIPFTVPRYGVWMIHTGIVLLIYGMAYYYSFKEEGRAFIVKGQTVSNYYDNWERRLYVRAEGTNIGDDTLVLRSLPRFKSYPELNDRRLKGLEPVVLTRDKAGNEQVAELHRMLGVPDKIRLDVEGYWPYAEIVTDYVRGNTGQSGIRVEARGPNGDVLERRWVVGDGEGHGDEHIGPLEIEHRQLTSDDAVAALLESAGKVHQLEVNGEKLTIEVGKSYTVAGYKLDIERFEPAFPAMNGEKVQILTFMVTPPQGEQFRRQTIFGREKVTDWKLGDPAAGPMGKRQTEPLDAKLITRYTFNDALRLLPHGDGDKHLILTTPTKTWLVSTSPTRPQEVKELAGGKGSVSFGGGAAVSLERVDGVQRVESAVEVPREKRDRNFGEQGLGQVVAVRVSAGNWSRQVFVPYQQWALSNRWSGGEVKLPNGRTLQLALGHRIRPIAPDMKTGLATAVTLDSFDLKSYDGGSPSGGMQRDFISTLTIKEPNGRERTGKAHMNNPIYFGGSPALNIGDTYWTLFQAQWDPNGQRFTVLGVGNRPGTGFMTAGSILMTIGLMYAFYVKPLIIRSRKQKALAEAEAKGKLPSQKGDKGRRAVVMEGVEGRVSV